MLCSVTVLGPGDQPPSRSLDERKKDESADDGQLVLTAPAGLKRRGYNLNVRVYRGEDLPKMDYYGTCDSFVALKFNGVVMRTETCFATQMPEWNTLLQMPVFTPALSDTVELQLWDWDRANPDELIATHLMKFTDLLSSSMPPTWINLYGMPINETSLGSWLAEMMRKGEVEQTAYMGRILVSVNAQVTNWPEMIDKATPIVRGPITDTFVCIMDLYFGSEIPVPMGGKVMVELTWGPAKNTRQTEWTSLNSSSKYFEFSPRAGDGHAVQSAAEDSAEGGSEAASAGGKKKAAKKPPGCQFKTIAAQLPKVRVDSDDFKYRQWWDIIVNVYVSNMVGSVSRVGYLRFAAKDVLNFVHKPEWHPIKGLQSSSGKTQSCGSLLFSLGFGPESALPGGERPEVIDLADTATQKEWCVYAHIYQARNLPASKANGLANPYCVVEVGAPPQAARLFNTRFWIAEKILGRDEETGALKKPVEGSFPQQSTTSENTLNPVWYETMRVSKAKLPAELYLAPDISITVKDAGSGGAAGGDKVIGRALFPPLLATKEYWKDPRPKWLPLRLDAHHDSRGRPTSFKKTPYGEARDEPVGEILVRFEVVDVEEGEDHEYGDGKKPRNTWPETEDCKIMISTIGFRNLAQYGAFDVANPSFSYHIPLVPNVAEEKLHLEMMEEKLERDAEGEVEEDEGDYMAPNEVLHYEWDSRVGIDPPAPGAKKEVTADNKKTGVTSGPPIPQESPFVGPSPFCLSTVVLNMRVPKERFYCNSLTVIVRDSGVKRLGDSVVAAANVPLRPYVVQLEELDERGKPPAHGYGKLATKEDPKRDAMFLLPKLYNTRDSKKLMQKEFAEEGEGGDEGEGGSEDEEDADDDEEEGGAGKGAAATEEGSDDGGWPAPEDVLAHPKVMIVTDSSLSPILC